MSKPQPPSGHMAVPPSMVVQDCDEMAELRHMMEELLAAKFSQMTSQLAADFRQELRLQLAGSNSRGREPQAPVPAQLPSFVPRTTDCDAPRCLMKNAEGSPDLCCEDLSPGFPGLSSSKSAWMAPDDVCSVPTMTTWPEEQLSPCGKVQLPVLRPTVGSESSAKVSSARTSRSSRGFGDTFNGRKLVGKLRAEAYDVETISSVVRCKSEYILVQETSSFRRLHELASAIVLAPAFDWCVCVLIVLNAVFLGAQADYMARNQATEVPEGFRTVEMIFCAVFVFEIFVKVFAFRWNYFTMPTWQWNVFDLVVVALQVLEEITALIGSSFLPHNASSARILRVLRLMRVIRLARLLRMIHELRVLVLCIGNSLRALGWTVLLLFILIYSVSIIITQLVSDHLSSLTGECSSGACQSTSDDLLHYYGNLPRSMLSLFEAISGGLDWDTLLNPLITDISPLLGALFCFYVIFTTLSMMNVVTGIFVDSVLTSAKNEKDAFLLSNATEIFKEAKNGLISRQQFLGMLHDAPMMEFFQSIDVDVSMADSLFTLMDLDDSGEISVDELFAGCIKLRGSAKALDTAVLVRDVNKVLECLGTFER